MRIERGEGYARLVGRWEAEQHPAAIDSPSCRYYLAREGDDVAGFAILQNVGSENQCLRLRRIAARDAGRGTGSRLLRSLLKICFDDLGAHRVELFVFEDNERAHRAYLKNGFVEEGIVRGLHLEQLREQGLELARAAPRRRAISASAAARARASSSGRSSVRQ